MQIDQIIAKIASTPAKGRRRLVALVGAPASGKTTLAHKIADQSAGTFVVPMDGFHLDNALLDKRGLRARKGAPATFDAAGFAHLLQRLAAGEDAIYPTFDRALDKSIAGSGEIAPGCETILVEGNYLLLDDPNWKALRPLWDLTFKLDVPRDVLRERLLERWRSFGYSEEEAARKADENDLPNADLVNTATFQADIVLQDPNL